MKNQIRDEESDKKKTIIRIVVMVIIIILLLLLITSCTSNFWGRIGKMFTSEGHVIIDNDTENNKEIVLNKDLTFTLKSLTINLGDIEPKLKFKYQNINPKKFSCSTSDAKIATCYVKDGYVIISPKKKGKVTVFVETLENGKVYRATTEVSIKEATKGIVLASKKGTINLAKNSFANIYYNLVGIKGNIEVTSSNPKVATAIAEDGVLKITAYKTGKTTITLTLEDNDIIYKATYTINVINNASSGGNSSIDNNGGNNTNDPNKPDEPNKPTDPSNPTDPTEPEEPQLSSNKYLSNLTTNKGTLSPSFNANINNYIINVVDIDYLDLNATLADSKATIIYNYNNELNRGSLNNLKLENGANTATIIVTAENGDINTYTITINKTTSTTPPSSNNKLSSLKIDGKEYLTGDSTSYVIDVPNNTTKLNIEAIPEVSSSSITATIKYLGSDGMWHTDAIDDLSNIDYSKVVTDGIITINVIAEDGSTKPYTVTVKRKEPVHNYTIELPSEIEIDLTKFKDDFNLPYVIKDNGVIVNGIPTVNYEVPSDLTIDNTTGKITIKTIKEDITKNITLTYEGVTATSKIIFTTKNFYLKPVNSSTEIAIDKNGNSINPDLDEVLLDTNIFSNTKTIKVKNISNGIRLYDKDNPDIYTDITTTNSNIIISAEEQNGSKNPVIKIKADGITSPSEELIITGHIYNKDFNTTTTLTFTTKYKVIIYANGGQFSDFEPDKLFYDYLLASSDTLDLNSFNPYKLDDTDNCIYYELASFNTLANGSGTTYPLDAILNGPDINYAVNSDLELYAIYDESNGLTMETKDKFVYITELELFNDKATDQYKKEAIIYPGAEGAYLLDIENQYYDQMIVTGMTLTEDTVCVASGCLNMGYIIKHPISDTEFEYYHSTPNGINNSEYELLHGSSTNISNPTFTKDITFQNPITLNKGDKTQFSFLWKWLDNDDITDTEIGKRAINVEEKYILSMKLNYKVINTSCIKGTI